MILAPSRRHFAPVAPNVLLALLLLLLWSAPARGDWPQDTPPIDYRVDLSRAHAQLVAITMTVPSWDRPEMDVHLPVWRPGRYQVLDMAGSVRTLRAEAADGTPLDVEKTHKASWRVRDVPPGDVRVTYEIYANSLADRTRHADATHAFLSGSAVFLYLHERRDHPTRVFVDAPAGWRVASGMDMRDGALHAPTYDVLVDSPIEAGEHLFASRTVCGVEFELAVWGETAWAQRPTGINLDRVMDDIEKLANAQIDLFGAFPATRYLFILHVAPGLGGGTEHLNSTICCARPETFDDDKAYIRFLGLLSHELFHTWNVKAFRPADLTPYDYQHEDYTRALWLAEGVTSYYDALFVVRAGQQKPAAYLETLATTIRGELERPGAALQSLEDSSFDAWIKFSKPTPDAPNSTVSFYSRGEITALALDLAIRRASNDASSLDDVMRTLYRRFPDASRGYTPQDVIDAVNDAASSEFSSTYFEPWFAAHIRGVEHPPYADLFTHVGLELRRKAADPPTEPYSGLRLRDEGSFALVTQVWEDGPAHAAGFIADDLVLALDGRRLKAADLTARLRALSEGGTGLFTVMRRDRLLEIPVTPAWRDAGGYEIRQLPERTDAQRAAYERWLWIKPTAEAPADDNAEPDAKPATEPTAEPTGSTAD